MKAKEKRSERIPVMFREDEAKRIEQAAKQAGMPVSSFIYGLVMQALDKKGKQ